MNIDLGDIAAILLAISTIYLAWRKSAPEQRNLEGETKESEASAVEKRANAAETYEQMATRQAAKIKDLQEEVETLKCEIGELKTALKERDQLLVEWQAGISLLINQLIVNRIKPVWVPAEIRIDDSDPEEANDGG